MRIGVVFPTLSGREGLLERTRIAYEATEAELVFAVVRNADGVAEGWMRGAEALADQGCDYLHLSADDVLPASTWAVAAIEAIEEGVYPSPRLLKEDGSLESCGTLGGGMWLPEVEDGAPAQASGVPFLPFEMWEQIKPLPKVHYYADDFVAYMARRAGLIPRVVRDYCFTHLDGQLGRSRHILKGEIDRVTVIKEIGERAPAALPC